MRIKVTLDNILEYGLDTLTGNSRADLLAKAEELHNNGLDLYVTIPDAAGGDTEAPAERNAFEHYSAELPVPEGPSHKQKSINLTEDLSKEEQLYLERPCSYKPIPQIDGKLVLICKIHGAGSKHSIDLESHEPCLVVDPYDD